MVFNICALFFVATFPAIVSAQDVTVPPLVIAPSGEWDGADGPWSTFNFGVGTPVQAFRCIPGISSPVIILPMHSDWCNETCEAQTTTLRSEQSSTWKNAGIGVIPQAGDYINDYDDTLFEGEDLTGIWGVDSVYLGPFAKDIGVSEQYVIGVTRKRFYVGTFGLTVGSLGLSGELRSTYMEQLYSSAKAIPSRSFGYTAGSAQKNTTGSLVLGGYDISRFDSSTTLSWPMPSARNTSLVVQLTAITVSDGETSSWEPHGNDVSTPFNVDSAVPQIWLPEEACQILETKFQLTWDDSLKLYLINEAAYERLARDKPEVRFTLTDGTKSINYTLPYTAFTLTLAFPLVDTSTYYFPLKRASNTSLPMLGRAFLQETYITVDYERSNFSISQAYPDGGSTRIVAITPTTNLSSDSTPNGNTTTYRYIEPPTHTLSSAAYAGIGVGAGIAALLVIGVFVVWRRRWGVFRPKNAPEQDQYLKAEVHGDDKKRVEAMEKERYELETADHTHELRGLEAPSVEVPGIHLVHELPESEHSTRIV